MAESTTKSIVSTMRECMEYLCKPNTKKSIAQFMCLCYIIAVFISGGLQYYSLVTRSPAEPQTIHCENVTWENMTWYGTINGYLDFKKPFKMGITETGTLENSTATLTGDTLELAFRVNVITDGIRNMFWEEENFTLSYSYTTSKRTTHYTLKCDEYRDKRIEIIKNWASEYVFRLTGITKTLACCCLFQLNFMVSVHTLLHLRHFTDKKTLVFGALLLAVNAVAIVRMHIPPPMKA